MVILKPVVIIAIIFSITIVLAGIGIAAMTGAAETLPAETLPATPTQQMNVESEVAEEELVQQNKAFEDTSIPIQNYAALHEKQKLEHHAPEIKTEVFNYFSASLQFSPASPSDCNGEILDIHQTLNEKQSKLVKNGELKLETRLIQNPSNGECVYITAIDNELPDFSVERHQQLSSMAEIYGENFPVVVSNDEYASHPFILEVIEKKKNNVEQKDLENTVAIIITGQLQDKGYTTFTIEGVFQRSSAYMVIDGYDPLYLTQGNQVNVIPLDYGFKNNNQYTLTAINGDYSTSITWTPLP